MKSEAMVNFAYVYILQSLNAPEHYYVGFTQDLHERLRRHNSGEVIGNQ
jgi:predicted GIY-YIG superfamily endonuclease